MIVIILTRIILVAIAAPCMSWVTKYHHVQLFAPSILLRSRSSVSKIAKYAASPLFQRDEKKVEVTASVTMPSMDNPFEMERLFGDVFDGNQLLNLAPFEDLTEEQQQTYIDTLLNERELRRLSSNMQNMLQEKWDIENGVYTVPPKPKPLKFNVDLMVYHAKKAFLSGDYPLAIKTYSQAVEYDPGDGRGWQGLGIIYFKQRQYAMAEKAYLDGLYYDANNPYLLQGYSNMIIKLGRVENARKLLLQSVKHHPHHAASWLLLAELDERKGDITSARSHYTRAVEGQPDNFVAVHALGTLELRQRNYDLARQYFQRAFILSPRSIHSLHALAKLESTTGNYTKALEYYETAIQRFPTFTYCYNGKVEIYELQQRYEEARVEFQRGAPYAKQEGDAGFFQSWACFEHRQLDHYIRRAERAFRAFSHLEHFFPASYLGYRSVQSSLASKKNFPFSFSSSAFASSNATSTVASNSSSAISHEVSALNVQAKKHEPAEEEELVLNVLSASDGEKGVLFVLTHIVQEHNARVATGKSPLLSSKELAALETTIAFVRLKMREVRQHFRTATRLNKYHSHSWVAWAHFERKLGSSEMARKLLVAGIANFPHSKNIGRFHAAMGALASDQGDLPTARACFDRALATTPPQHSLPVYLEFIRAELEVGPSRQATKLVEKALKLFPNNDRLLRYAKDV